MCVWSQAKLQRHDSGVYQGAMEDGNDAQNCIGGGAGYLVEDVIRRSVVDHSDVDIHDNNAPLLPQQE
eukprot:1186093-Prorocentrum_minimum.AAC.3